MIWYNKDKTVMVDLGKVESFVFGGRFFGQEFVQSENLPTGYGGIRHIYKPALSINWDKIILWEDDAKEVWELLKAKLKL